MASPTPHCMCRYPHKSCTPILVITNIILCMSIIDCWGVCIYINMKSRHWSVYGLYIYKYEKHGGKAATIPRPMIGLCIYKYEKARLQTVCAGIHVNHVHQSMIDAHRIIFEITSNMHLETLSSRQRTTIHSKYRVEYSVILRFFKEEVPRDCDDL